MAASFSNPSSSFKKESAPFNSSFTFIRVSEHRAVNKNINLQSKNIISSGTLFASETFSRSVNCSKMPFLQHNPAATGLLKTKLHKHFCTSIATDNLLS